MLYKFLPSAFDNFFLIKNFKMFEQDLTKSVPHPPVAIHSKVLTWQCSRSDSSHWIGFQLGLLPGA